MTQSKASPFRWPLRIYYEDTDAGGVVYYASYLKFFERARTEWLRYLGVDQPELARQQQVMFVVKTAFVDYHLPARLDDELELTTVIEKPGRASLVFVQEIWRDDQRLISARFKVGCVGSQSIRPCAIPPVVMDAIRSRVFVPYQ